MAAGHAVVAQCPVERADVLFCLAAALRPPPAGMTAATWCGALADDLDDLAAVLGPPAASASTRLRRFAAGPQAGEDWLVEYSRLFLVPPVKVALNAGIYLEGSVGGTAAQMIGQCYASAGYAPRADFHDLPDHVALQLEFVGELLERAAQGDDDALAMAEAFTDDFITSWAPPLKSACDAALEAGFAAAEPFGALAQLLTELLAEEGAGR